MDEKAKESGSNHTGNRILLAALMVFIVGPISLFFLDEITGGKLPPDIQIVIFSTVGLAAFLDWIYVRTKIKKP